MTEAYRLHDGLLSAPMRRALAFRYVMEHQTIVIGEGELIVGEKGPAPKATPTYPELCCHTLSDLDILDSREKIPFKVSPETREVYEQQIIPFWQGKTMRERLFAEMTDEWLAAYEAGIFTEFMEQRAPGPHRAGRQDLPPGPARLPGRHRRGAGQAGLCDRSATRSPRARSSRPCASRWTR